MGFLILAFMWSAAPAWASNGWFNSLKCAWEDGDGSASSAEDEIVVQDCEVQRPSETDKIAAIKSKWNSAGEGSACVDLAGQEYTECLDAGENNASCVLAASMPPGIDASKPYCGLTPGIYGSLTVIVERFVAEANCSRLREKCIRDVLANRGSLCGVHDAEPYRAEVFAHIQDRATCLQTRAQQSEGGGNKLIAAFTGGSEGAMDASRAMGVTDKISCNENPGYRSCAYTQTVAAIDPGPSAPAPVPPLNPGSPVAITTAAVQAPVLPNTCSGTILGDGVTVITSPTCQVMQNSQAITIQSVSATGQKVSQPAQCEATATSNTGESVQCQLTKSAVPSAPLYKLEIDNRAKSCRTSGWTMTCPEKAIESALARRVKVLGASGDQKLSKPVEGYAHYSKRTGRISTAATGQVRTNGVILDLDGKPVMAFTRTPASISGQGDAYAMDKFILQTSRTPLSEELEKVGAPLMREISLGDK
jgi:hypothetical protein